MNANMFDQFATELPKRLSQLRAEAAKYRQQRNEARRETDRLRESNAGLRHELATLRAKLEASSECRECHCQTAADSDSIAKGECPRSGAPIGGPGQCHPSHSDGCPQCPIRALTRV